MHRIPLFCLATLLVACGPQPTSVLVEAGPAGVYQWQERVMVPVRALLTNTGESSVWLRTCDESVEKQVGEEWLPGFTGGGCLLMYDAGQEIRPHRELLVVRDLHEDAAAEGGSAFPHGIAGHYRMKLDIGAEVNGQWVPVPEEQRTFEFDILE